MELAIAIEPEITNPERYDSFYDAFIKAVCNRYYGYGIEGDPRENIINERLFTRFNLKGEQTDFHCLLSEPDGLKPTVYVPKIYEVKFDEIAKLVNDATNILLNNDVDEYQYRSYLFFGTHRLPFLLQFHSCLIYQFQSHELDISWQGADEFIYRSKEPLRTGWTGCKEIDVFHTFIEGRTNAFHHEQADKLSHIEAEKIALLLSVIMKLPCYTESGVLTVKPDKEFGSLVDLLKEKKESTDNHYVKPNRVDFSVELNRVQFQVGETRDLVIPSDILQIYDKFVESNPEKQEILLRSMAMYRSALPLLTLNPQKGYFDESAQANMLLFSALENIAGGGERVKSPKGENIRRYVHKRLGKTDKTKSIIEDTFSMWDKRCGTTHQAMTWAQRLKDLNPGTDWSCLEEYGYHTLCLHVEKIVNAIIIDYIAS